MISGAITKNPNFCINSNLNDLPLRKKPTLFCFSNNTHLPKLPKPSLLIENGVFSSKSSRFRTKATISDETMVYAIEANMSLYELLGISESGSFSEIKQAYKQLARKYHPDVSPPDRTEEYTKRFILVQEAYETLSDPSRRAMYDRDMARGLHLAFSARKGYDEGLMKNEWKNHWRAQVAELKKKSMKEESSSNMSWAAKMRRRRFESDGID
ncbi:hypothetical protein AQUCO_03400054v1 [Aquilegia coerulea]|uniref:J domain-containing protein n=2 Tax=Aquilegia coerulea TaxID=218851 RepID=A0A2G5CXB1_AQUCA|nr:hypothetical protein AQUCO_03400054v1 [Aquilegia coerulea]